MQIAMVGLGRMGGNMARRLMRGGHECVVYDAQPESVQALAREGAVGAESPAALVERLAPPRAVWMMVPVKWVDSVIDTLAPSLAAGDILIDGGNSHFKEDIRRAKALAARGIHYVDVGTSGGVWGLERGYCLMVGGEREPVRRLEPVLETLAPPMDAAPRTPGREEHAGRATSSSAERGYLHCGPHGAGHFVKMVHNGIEYGLMAAYAEGLQILHHANAGKTEEGELAPGADPEHYRYDFDLSEVTELWRRGSVIGSWLLDLTAQALLEDADLTRFNGRVSDSGEGRWTVQAAVDEAVPAHVLTAALYERFDSRGRADFAGRVLSAMRFAFGGHLEPGGGR